jgi:hypothetical protein
VEGRSTRSWLTVGALRNWRRERPLPAPPALAAPGLTLSERIGFFSSPELEEAWSQAQPWGHEHIPGFVTSVARANSVIVASLKGATTEHIALLTHTSIGPSSWETS